jgi:hypothetical protein
MLVSQLSQQACIALVLQIITSPQFCTKNSHLTAQEQQGLRLSPAVWPFNKPVFTPYAPSNGHYSQGNLFQRRTQTLANITQCALETATNTSPIELPTKLIGATFKTGTTSPTYSSLVIRPQATLTHSTSPKKPTSLTSRGSSAPSTLKWSLASGILA